MTTKLSAAEEKEIGERRSAFILDLLTGVRVRVPAVKFDTHMAGLDEEDTLVFKLNKRYVSVEVGTEYYDVPEAGLSGTLAEGSTTKGIAKISSAVMDYLIPEI